MQTKRLTIKELIEHIRELQEAIGNISSQMDEVLDRYHVPSILADIKELRRKKELKKPTTSWLQRRYRIGYARAARLLDELRERGLIK
jgi:DNA segregation ATPase FtsK/SpoIIIE-like protein